MMADKENSPLLKIHRYLCKLNDKMAREYSEIRSKKGEFCLKAILSCKHVKLHIGAPVHEKSEGQNHIICYNKRGH